MADTVLEVGTLVDISEFEKLGTAPRPSLLLRER